MPMSHNTTDVCRFVDSRHAIGVYRRLNNSGYRCTPETGPVFGGVVKVWFSLPSEVVAPAAFSAALKDLDAAVDEAVSSEMDDAKSIERCMAL
jgi:hypothetical protein